MANLNNKILYDEGEMYLSKTDVQTANDIELVEGDHLVEDMIINVEEQIETENEAQQEPDAEMNDIMNVTTETTKHKSKNINKRTRS